MSSVNSYGYSPQPLTDYLKWIEEILGSGSGKKPFIISVGSGSEMREMLERIEPVRSRVGKDRVAVEVNTSCPNLGGELIGYNMEKFGELVQRIAEYWREHEDLVIGLKLPPYVWDGDIAGVVNAISEHGKGSIRFVTSTNTVGNTLEYEGESVGPVKGGMGGCSIHGLALGNVHGLRQKLDEKQLGNVEIIGVGGVSDRESYLRFKKAGARVVGVATALGLFGTDIFKAISTD